MVKYNGHKIGCNLIASAEYEQAELYKCAMENIL